MYEHAILNSFNLLIISSTALGIIELESLVRAFLLYQYVDIGGMSYSDAIKLLKYDSQEYSIIKQDYLQLKEFLNEYQTSPRGLE